MNECYPCYPGECYAYPCAGMPLLCPFSPPIEGLREPTIAELREAVRNLGRNHKELAAEQLLDAERALKLLSCEGSEHQEALLTVSLQVDTAKEIMKCEPTVANAMKAMKHVEGAIEYSPHDPTSQDWGDDLDIALDKALKALRDCMICRAQDATGPIGLTRNKKAYKRTLEDAYGGPIPDKVMSQFMNSYEHTIYLAYAQFGAFPANNRLDSFTRGEPRAGKKKNGPPNRRVEVLQALKKKEAPSSSRPQMSPFPQGLHHLQTDPAARCGRIQAPGPQNYYYYAGPHGLGDRVVAERCWLAEAEAFRVFGDLSVVGRPRQQQQEVPLPPSLEDYARASQR